MTKKFKIAIIMQGFGHIDSREDKKKALGKLSTQNARQLQNSDK